MRTASTRRTPVRPTATAAALALLLPVLAAGAAAGEWELSKAVVAMVNGQPVYKSELEELASQEASRLEREGGRLTDELRQQLAYDALRSLVRSRLVRQEARKQNIYIGRDEVNEYLEERALRDTERNRQRAEEVLLFDELMRAEQRPITEPTPKDVRDFFRENKDLFTMPRLVRARQITVPKTIPELHDRERRQLARIREAIVDGEQTFAEAAEEHCASKMDRDVGGLIIFPGTERNDFFFPPANEAVQRTPLYHGDLIRALVDLEAGVVSEILETEGEKGGFHILYIEKERPARVVSFSQAQKHIYRFLVSHKRILRQRDWLLRVVENSRISWHSGDPISREDIMPPLPEFDVQRLRK